MKKKQCFVIFPALILLMSVFMILHDKNEEIISMKIGNSIFQIEIADTVELLQKGLSNRDDLRENSGMMFIFPFSHSLTFWMQGTSIPLTLAFLSNDGKIMELHDMRPYSTEEVTSRRPGKFALELSRGAFSRAGALIGSRIEIIDAPKKYQQLFN